MICHMWSYRAEVIPRHFWRGSALNQVTSRCKLANSVPSPNAPLRLLFVQTSSNVQSRTVRKPLVRVASS